MAAAETKRYPHEPDYIVAPGEILQDAIDALGMTQADLAKRNRLVQEDRQPDRARP